MLIIIGIILFRKEFAFPRLIFSTNLGIQALLEAHSCYLERPAFMLSQAFNS